MPASPKYRAERAAIHAKICELGRTGMKVVAIAAELGTSQGTISRALAAAGLQRSVHARGWRRGKATKGTCSRCGGDDHNIRGCYVPTVPRCPRCHLTPPEKGEHVCLDQHQTVADGPTWPSWSAT